MANWDKPTEADGQDNDFYSTDLQKNISLKTYDCIQKRGCDKINDEGSSSGK